MVRIPTTERQFYNLTPKANTLEVFSKAMMPAAQDYRKNLMAQQDVKIDTNSTKARVEADKLVNDLRLKYQANPDSADMKKEMQEGLSEIWQRYGADIDPIAKGKWDLTVNKLNGAYEIANNQWGIKQREENTKINVAENMNTNYQLAYEYGMNGNLTGAIAELDVSYNQLNDYASKGMGSMDSKALLKDYKKQFIKNFIDGQMQTNPEAALQTINNKDIQRALEDPREIEKFKTYGMAKLDNVKKQKKYNAIYSDIMRGNGLLNSSINKNLSLEEINSLMPKDASDSYKSLILSMNGYKTTKSGKDGKISDGDKALAEQDVYAAFAALSNSDKTTPEDWRKFTDNIYKMMDTKQISLAKGMKFINDFATPIAQKEKDVLETKGWFVWKKSTGYEDFIKSIPQASTDGVVDKAVKKKIEAQNAALKNEAAELYYDGLRKEVDSNPNYNSLQDLFSDDSPEKKQIIMRAGDYAMQQLNQRRFERLRYVPAEKQPNVLLNSTEAVNNSNNLNNSKQGSPIKGIITDVATSKGKYYARYFDGSIEEISRQTYLQNGGK